MEGGLESKCTHAMLPDCLLILRQTAVLLLYRLRVTPWCDINMCSLYTLF